MFYMFKLWLIYLSNDSRAIKHAFWANLNTMPNEFIKIFIDKWNKTL